MEALCKGSIPTRKAWPRWKAISLFLLRTLRPTSKVQAVAVSKQLTKIRFSIDVFAWLFVRAFVHQSVFQTVKVFQNLVSASWQALLWRVLPQLSRWALDCLGHVAWEQSQTVFEVQRDRPHATQRLLKRPWEHDSEIHNLLQKYILGSTSISQKIQHSPWLQSVFNAYLKEEYLDDANIFLETLISKSDFPTWIHTWSHMFLVSKVWLPIKLQPKEELASCETQVLVVQFLACNWHIVLRWHCASKVAVACMFQLLRPTAGPLYLAFRRNLSYYYLALHQALWTWRSSASCRHSDRISVSALFLVSWAEIVEWIPFVFCWQFEIKLKEMLSEMCEEQLIMLAMLADISDEAVSSSLWIHCVLLALVKKAAVSFSLLSKHSCQGLLRVADTEQYLDRLVVCYFVIII